MHTYGPDRFNRYETDRIKNGLFTGRGPKGYRRSDERIREDISDRPPPEESVPGLVELLEGDLPSGRYKARALAERAGALGEG